MPDVPKSVYQKEKQILYARHILLNIIQRVENGLQQKEPK